MRNRVCACLLSLLLIAAQAPAAVPEAPHTVEGKASDGTHYYEDSLEIAAPAARLWAAFTDAAEFRRWSAPISTVDFRLGGVIEASYDPQGRIGSPDNIRNAFIAYVPGRLLVFRNVQAPAMLPGHDVYGQTVKVIELTALDGERTRVTISGIGFGEGESFRKLYSFFIGGDARMLEALRAAFAKAGNEVSGVKLDLPQR